MIQLILLNYYIQLIFIHLIVFLKLKMEIEKFILTDLIQLFYFYLPINLI